MSHIVQISALRKKLLYEKNIGKKNPNFFNYALKYRASTKVYSPKYSTYWLYYKLL